MIVRLRQYQSLLLVVVVAMGVIYSATGQDKVPGVAVHVTANGVYRLYFESELEPISINQIHSWTIYLEASDGRALLDPRLTVTGGMPQHDHGLPTAPRMTRQLGPGQFLVEGLKFHMNGTWQITIDVVEANRSDSVTFNLDV